MNTKKERREAAQKKAKQQKVMIAVICAVGLVALGITLAVYIATRPDSRLFATDSGFSVTLYENGRFGARLFHGNNFSGSFVENEDTGAITFTHGGNVTTTIIEDDTLILPNTWRSFCRAHSHEVAFAKVR